MADDSLPIQPVLSGGPQLATPDYGHQESTAEGVGSVVGNSFMTTAGAQLVERGVNTAYADLHGGDAIIPQDKAQAMLKQNNYDASGVPAAGWSESALATEMERQQRMQDMRLATSRANLSGTTQFVGSLVGGLGDPITLAAGPLAGKATGFAESTFARVTAGAAEGAGITGGEESLQNHLQGHDEDTLSWSTLRDITLGSAPGMLLHSAFGSKAVARPGEKLTLDNVDALERSEAAAKRMGVSVDEVVSPAGAVGRYQIMPATARGFGLKGTDAEITEQLKDPAVNKDIGGKLLDQLARRYGNDPEAIAVAYNAGPRAADHWKAIGRDDSALPQETRGYLSRLRGVPYEDRQDAARLSVAQLGEDSPVDVQPVSLKPRINAFSIQDEHDADMQSLYTQAMRDAVPTRDRIFQPDESTKQSVAEEPDTTDHATAYTTAAKDAQDRVAGLGPEAQETFKTHMADEESTPELGTLQHDEVTKGITAAVNCGIMKGLAYGAD